MTRNLLIPIVLLSLIAGTRLPADALLDLGDGNFLRGQPMGLREGVWKWKHGLSGGEMEFPAPQVRRILFSGATPPNPAGDIVLLDNGDVLAGTIRSLDDKSLVVVSPVLGEMTLDRNRLRTARLAPRAGTVVFRDEGELKNWTLAEKGAAVEWSSAGGVLRFDGKGHSQTLARDVKLPASADIGFEMTWDSEKEDDGGFGAVFSLVLAAGDAVGNSGNGCYKIQFARNWATVEREYGSESGRSSNTLGRLQLHQLRDLGQKVRVRVVLDRPRKKIHVFLNGREVGEVVDDSDDELTGTWLGFQTNGTGNFRLRRLEVESWNGFLGNKLATTVKSATTKDLVITTDGDEIFGKINTIREENGRGRVVETAIAVSQSKPMLIPVSRIAHLSFARGEDPPSSASPSATLLLDDGSRVSAEVGALDELSLRAHFHGRTDVEIPVARILAIEFEEPTPADGPEKEKSPEPEE